LDYIIILWLY